MIETSQARCYDLLIKMKLPSSCNIHGKAAHFTNILKCYLLAFELGKLIFDRSRDSMLSIDCTHVLLN